MRHSETRKSRLEPQASEKGAPCAVALRGEMALNHRPVGPLRKKRGFAQRKGGLFGDTDEDEPPAPLPSQ